MRAKICRSGSELAKDSSSSADTTLSTLPDSRRSSEVVKKAVSRGSSLMDKALEVQEVDMPRVTE